MTRLIFSTVLFLLATAAHADSTAARCDVYPAGSDTDADMMPCTFSQRQGHITIVRDDGVVHDLTPVGTAPGNFEDQDGNRVFRQSGLGDQGQIFRLPGESVFVYWSTAALGEPDPDNPTAPFSTDEYDATTLLRCKTAKDAEFQLCPAGILRMEDNQASIVVISPDEQQFTINFMKDYVNATNREVSADLDGDTWNLQFANGESWQVPLAAIEGG